MEINKKNLLNFINENLDNIELIKSSYINLLKELSECNEMSLEIFMDNLIKIHNVGIIVIAYIGSFDSNDFEIIGSGTIIIEPKIIRNCKNVGHIEDIVVKTNYRGKKISHDILSNLKKYAYENNCYKIILDCENSITNVYKKNGFEMKGIQMAIYF